MEDITFAVPELPSKLPPIKDNTIFDSKPPVVVKETAPWFVFFGIGLALCVIVSGCYCIYKDRTDYEKDGAFSTSSSAFDAVEEDGSQEEGEEAFDNVEQEFVEGTYEDLDDYQVQTIAPTEDDQDSQQYEIYVF